MIQTQWQRLIYYQPSDFRYPDKLHESVVTALDWLSQILKKKAQVLSDWRPVSAERPGSQHPLGRAIDVTWPDLDPLKVLDTIKNSRLFSGIGLYRNEKGGHSFHLDTRVNRTVDAPALWGAFIQPGATGRDYQYTTLSAIVKIIAEHGRTALSVALLLGGLWLLTRLMRNL